MTVISGTATKDSGGPIDNVRVFQWPDGALVQATTPASDGSWEVTIPETAEYGISYLAAGCIPITHGPYLINATVELVADEYFDKVVALLHLDENWKDIISKTWTPVSSPSFSTDVKRFGTASAFFVNGSHLEADASDAWAFGTADFTVECWAYASELPTTYYRAPMGNWYSSTGGCFFLRPNGVMSWHSGSLQVASGTGVIQVAKWHHLAYSRKNGVGRLFVDGVKVGPDLADTTNFSWTQAWRIGGNRVNTDWWRGFVDEVRITKGVARYVDGFEIPNTSFPDFGPELLNDPYYDYVHSLLHMDGEQGSAVFVDEKAITWTAIDAFQDESQKQYGSASCALTTAAALIEAESPEFSIGASEDFTFEGFYHDNNLNLNQGTLLDNRFGSYGAACVIYRSISSNRLYFYSNGANRFYEVFPRNTWFHWALVRKSGVTRLYINGKSVNSYNDTHTYSQTKWRLGNNLSGNDSCKGFLDEFRFTKGVARYTGNFLPPTKAFPNQGTLPPSTDGLVHFYTMDTLINGNAKDEIGNSDLVLNGIAQAPGHFGQALAFDGVDDVAELPPAIFNGDAFAYTGIAKVTQETGNFFLLCHRDDNQALIQFSVQDNQIVLQVRSSTSSIASGSVPNTGEYFFFVLNFDKNGRCELFINNALAVDFATPAGNYTSQGTIIGPYSRDGVERVFGSAAPGYVDHLRVYNRVLSIDDVGRLYTENYP